MQIHVNQKGFHFLLILVGDGPHEQGCFVISMMTIIIVNKVIVVV